MIARGPARAMHLSGSDVRAARPVPRDLLRRRQDRETQILVAAVRAATTGAETYRILTARPCISDAGKACAPSASDTLPLAVRIALRRALRPCPAADEESALLAVSRAVPIGNEMRVLVNISERAPASGPDRLVFGETVAASRDVLVQIADRGAGASIARSLAVSDGPGGPLSRKRIPDDATCHLAPRPH
jgi:hypothetical protein